MRPVRTSSMMPNGRIRSIKASIFFSWPEISTITCSGDPDTLEQIIKQIEKLVDVVHAIDHTGQAVIESELALVKIKIGLKDRTEILQIAENFKAKVVDFGAESLILRCAGETDKLDAFITLLRPFGITELVRSGKILMARGLDDFRHHDAAECRRRGLERFELEAGHGEPRPQFPGAPRNVHELAQP